MSQALDLQSGIRTGSPYLFELECLRGVAIMLVFLFHAYGISLGNSSVSPTLPMSFIIGGNTGVTLFFVLSGFLLGLPWLRHILDPAARRPDISHYYLARALRILPLYYIAVAIAVIVSGNWSSGLSAALFGFVGFDIFPYSVVWWTLSTEVQFYVVLPLFFALYCAGGNRRALCLGLLLLWAVVYGFGAATQAQHPPSLSYLTSKSLFARLPAFLAGIGAALCYLKTVDRKSARKPRKLTAWLGLLMLVTTLAVLGCILQQVVVMGDRIAEQRWHVHHSYEALLWASIIYLALAVDLPGKAIVINKGMAVIGKLSYSIYLNHVPILFFLIYSAKSSQRFAPYENSAALYALPVVAFLCSVALSFLTYRVIELPFLQLKHRIPR